MAKKRSQVPLTERWNVEALYLNLEAWEKAFSKIYEQMEKHFPSVNAYKERVKENPQLLAPLLKDYFALQEEIEQLFVYAHLRHDEDIALDQHKAAFQSAMMLYHTFSQETAWVEPEILEMDASQLDFKGKDLAPYKNYLKQLLHQKQHVLPKEQEKLMAACLSPLQAINSAFSSINNVDLKFDPAKDETGKEHELTHASYQVLIKSRDRQLRKNAFLNMHNRFSEFENTIGDLLSGCVKKHLFNARMRGYASCLDAALFPLNIETSVYTNLTENIRKNISVVHRYIALRKKMLVLDEIHAFDMYVPVHDTIDLTFSFEEASQLIVEALSPLGANYQSILQKGLGEERWVDRYENVNKRSGAYSCSSYRSLPYILMNYQGTLNDLMTLSHEAGHSMHSYHSNHTQSFQDASYCIFVAEVASTFHEEMTFRYLYEKMHSKEEKAYLLSQKLDGIRATLFRQAMFAEFELKIHQIAEQNKPLTPALMRREYEELNRVYFGSEFTYDPQLFYEYLRIPHFYSNFYVYQYATGISAAYALVEHVLNGGEKAKDAYIQFLSSGGSDFPIDLLKRAGVDMTTQKPVETLIHRFASLLEQLEQLMGFDYKS